MPPKGSRVVRDEQDSRSDGSSVNQKNAAGNGRGKRQGAVGGVNGVGSQLKDAVTVNDSGSTMDRSSSNAFSWPQEPLELLQAYRSAHHLSTPSSFSNPRNQYLLTNPGIGRESPTMCRKKQKRKVGKEQLALAVRKNFNAAAVSEVEVMVGLINDRLHVEEPWDWHWHWTKSLGSYMGRTNGLDGVSLGRLPWVYHWTRD